MCRYIIELAYDGANYAGFQIQPNAITIQQIVEEAFEIYFKQKMNFVCSSRTDAGVHAHKNLFHVDINSSFDAGFLLKATYSINAILPKDIVIHAIFKVDNHTHARFSPVARLYEYHITQVKDPFLLNRAYYYPYKLDLSLLQKAASTLLVTADFSAFSKKHTQVHTNNCTIYQSEWQQLENKLVYKVRGNRFLRGMVRGLVGTMLKVGMQKLSLQEFEKILADKDQTKADFSTPPHGLYLMDVIMEL
jgi:tRNA pseudouridine38-40 synthase